MTEWLIQVDRSVLHLVNTVWANPLFDSVMPWVRAKHNWIPLYVAMFMLLVWRFKRDAWIPVLLCIAAVVISDQIASTLLKPVVQRLRPCQNELEHVRLVIECGGGYSFVSSHAANHFALALTFGSFFKAQKSWLLPLLLIWASLIAYAQVYIAYHYPSDVFCGAVIGLVVAQLLLILWRRKFENLRRL